MPYDNAPVPASTLTSKEPGRAPFHHAARERVEQINTMKVWGDREAEVPIEPGNVNDLYRHQVSGLGHRVTAYFNVNIADDPSMMITPAEGEALASFVIGET